MLEIHVYVPSRPFLLWQVKAYQKFTCITHISVRSREWWCCTIFLSNSTFSIIFFAEYFKSNKRDSFFHQAHTFFSKSSSHFTISALVELHFSDNAICAFPQFFVCCFFPKYIWMKNNKGEKVLSVSSPAQNAMSEEGIPWEIFSTHSDAIWEEFLPLFQYFFVISAGWKAHWTLPHMLFKSGEVFLLFGIAPHIKVKEERV